MVNVLQFVETKEGLVYVFLGARKNGESSLISPVPLPHPQLGATPTWLPAAS